MITKEKIEELEAYLRIFTHPQDRPMDATILELITEWRARQPDEPQEHVCIHCNRDKSWHQGADQKCYYGNGKTTFEVDSACTHCRKPKSAHHGEDLRCHLSAFHGVNTFQAEPVKPGTAFPEDMPEHWERICRHCKEPYREHIGMQLYCNWTTKDTFEPLSQ